MDEFHASNKEANAEESLGGREEPCILDEIKIEELAIDGICGVY